LGEFRRDVPIEVLCAAGITAVRDEDCGPCAQLGVTMAKRAGVRSAVLRAVLADNPDAMSPDVALVWKFTRATLAHDAAADEYREAIVKRWDGAPLSVWLLQSLRRESIQQSSTPLATARLARASSLVARR